MRAAILKASSCGILVLLGSAVVGACTSASDSLRDDEADLGAPADPIEEQSPSNAVHDEPHDCVHEESELIEPVGVRPPSASLSQAIGADTDPDYLALTAGATTVDAGNGSVSALALVGDSAFPVLVDESNRVFAAASRSGAGKALAFGHDNYLTGVVKTGNAMKIVQNAISWMSSKAAPVIGLEPVLTTLAASLNAAGYQTKYVTPSQLTGVNVYINRGYTQYTEAEYATIRSFVSNGGGLIVAAQGWSFAGGVVNMPANKMLLGTGIYIGNGFDVSAATDAVSPTPLTPLLNASYALARLTDTLAGTSNLSSADQTLASTAVERALALLPLSVQELYNPANALLVHEPKIAAATPFTPSTSIPGRLAVRIRHKLTQELPPEQITAHASAADFPGAIAANIPRESVTTQIDATYAGRDARFAYSGPAVPVWRSTGTYAAPGEQVTVTVPAALVNNGVAIQIGSHTDLLWNKSSWVRFPAIVRSYPITSTQMTVASAFGGTIFITVPGGKSLGPQTITLDNVVRAPLYVHGQTTLGDWMTIRDYPAPWAEVGSDKMIAMVPSTHVRQLDDPSQVMNRWDTIMDAVADLASISRQRVRAERYLADRDISAGYMHSGYPIMGPLGEAANLVSYSNLAINWGFWHEVGHNHQWQPWVLQGTTESSVNWWSVYISEKVFNLPRAKGHTALIPESRLQRAQTYAANGKKYASWGSDAWLPLEMYLQLHEWFGWDPFIQVNTEFYTLSGAASPSTDQAKVDQWTMRFAQKVGKNLGPFFTTTWGLPLSQATLDQMAQLAPWPASLPQAPGIEAEPNDACAQAQSLIAPSQSGTFTLTAKSDVDWFVLPVDASQVGKVVHVVTSAGSSNTDTVVEVFEGTCAGMTSLGGPSTNSTYHENWITPPLTQSGSIYVKVTYSAAATYAGNKYKVTVTYE